MRSNLTRRQLYDLIWMHPLAEVAAHLGIPEGEIQRICEEHRVPAPKAAFWQTKAAGKPAKRTTFTTTLNSSLELITFDPRRAPIALPAVEPAPAVAARPAPPRPKPAAKVTEEPVQWQIVANPLPLLVPVTRALRSTKADRESIIHVGSETIPSTSVGQASVERAIYILDNLLRRLIAQGFSCVLSRQHFAVMREQDGVEFKFLEQTARQPHEATLQELQAEARRLRGGGSTSDHYWFRAYPEFDTVSTGVLKLSITTYGWDGRRRNWRDSKRSPLEAQIPQIAEVLPEWIEGRRQRRLERERDARLWKRADENRGLAEARRKREDEREALITEIVQLQAKACDLRSWIDWAEPIEDADTRRMLDWARSRLKTIDRAVNPAAFGGWLREKKLFPEMDPYAALPTDPDIVEDEQPSRSD